MASNPTNKKPSQNRRKTNSPSGLGRFFADKRTHIALGVFFVVVAFIMAISTISHLKNGAADFSIIDSNQSITDMANNGQAENAAGAFGAWLSHVLLTEGLGIGSFILVIYLGLIGLALLGVMKIKFWSLTFKSLFSAIAISIIAGLVTLHLPSYTHWGGVHGRYANLWLEHIGYWPTSWAVTIVLLGLLFAIYLNPLKNIYERLSHMIVKRNKSKHIEPQPDDIILDEVGEINATEDAADANSSAEVDFTDDNSGPTSFSGYQTNLTTIDNSHIVLEELSDNNSNNKEKGQSEPTFTIKDTQKIEDGNSEDIDRGPDESLAYDPRADLSRFVFPSFDILTERSAGNSINPEEQQKNKDLIVKTLLDYKIPIQRIEATIGPTVTLYEIVPAEGVRIAQIQRLENDIALSLAALGIRIIAPIPGAGTVGIEVPNKNPQTVSIKSVLGSKKYAEACKKMALPMAMGATISNEIFIQDLAKMPHLLVAGATGQGKSVGLNCIIASLLYAKHPSELKFVFIDPKMVEFAAYRKLERHYLAKLPDSEEPIITDPTKVPATLSSLCTEMDNRYQLMSEANVRSVEEYNNKYCRHALNPEKGHKYMPYIVTIVDEFADLIMVGGKDVPMHIARIAQKGRAAGMHIIIATQRPSTDVISGMIKNNFPGRIAFRVMSMVDSKTILDRPGANQLIGRGDMLFLTNGHIERVQCAFIDTPEIDAITDHIDNQIGYESAYLLPEPVIEGAVQSDSYDPSKRDALFNDCARFIVTQSTASTSALQRRYSIGYNKAGKIMDQLEAAGVVGPAQGAKPRAVLMDAVTLETILQ